MKNIVSPPQHQRVLQEHRIALAEPVDQAVGDERQRHARQHALQQGGPGLDGLVHRRLGQRDRQQHRAPRAHAQQQ
jgi:hypothetical protein